MHKIKTKYSQFLFCALFQFSFIAVGYSQTKIPPKPSEQTSVYDDAKLLSGYEKNVLGTKAH